MYLMRKTIFHVLYGLGVAMAVSLTPLSGYGQTDTLKLTVKDAVNMAIQQNLMQKVSELELKKKEEKVGEYYAALYPNIKATGSYSRYLELPVIFIPEGTFGPGSGGAMKIGYDNSYSGGFSATLPIFMMNIYQSIRMGKTDVEISAEKMRENQINLTASVKNTFYNLLLLEQSYQVIEMSYQNAQANLENIQKLNASGIVSDYDAIRIKVQVDNLYPTLMQTKNTYNNLLNIFKVLLNVNDTIPVTLDHSELSTVTLEEIASPTEVWQQDNTTLRQLELSRKMIGIQEKMVRSSSLPSLVAMGNYQYQAQANDFKFNDYRWVPTSLVGLQLNIPIFSGFAVRKQLNQVKISAQQLDMQMEFTRSNLSAQVQNSVNAINTAIKKVESAQGNVTLAQKGYAIAQTRYNTGQATLLELNDADNAMMQARLNLIQAQFEYLNARNEYEKITGQSALPSPAN